MPRTKIIRDNFIPYHITARTVNKEPFCLPLEKVWKILIDQLKFAQFNFSADVIAFVLMSNHFHLLCRFPQGKMDKFMHEFMRCASLQINEQLGRINQLWGQRYYPCAITDEQYFYNAYKYVYRNPVDAKICNRAEEYRFSTLQSVCGLAPIAVPIHDELMLESKSLDSTLNWINQNFSEEEYLKTKQALNHAEFKVKLDKYRRPLLSREIPSFI